jgi:putative membrane protein
LRADPSRSGQSNGIPNIQRWMLGAVMLGGPLSGWGALYPSNTWLQVGPVALLLPFACRSLRRSPVSNLSAACMTAFVLLHLFAARWSYSFVPYEEWLPMGMNAAAGFERNMFDRLVHFMFGVLAMAPLVEIGVRYLRLSQRMALAFALLFVLAVGGLYEIFEWSLTLALAPDDAGAYNGEQGDMFDAQKDMALAGLGAVLMAPFLRSAVWWKGDSE